jgi:hypothetical protein
MAECPAHEDRSPSLSITRNANRWLLKCHAGCETRDVIRAATLTWADLGGSRKPTNGALGTEVDRYDYVDERGKLLYQIVRFEPKAFRACRPDGTWGIGNIRRVLYHLPKLIHADQILVLAGEKDVERAEKLGFVATTNVFGEKSKWTREYSETLRGKLVIILPDADKTGSEHVREVAQSLLGVAASVKLLKPLPGVGPKGDLSDFADKAGKDAAEALRALIEDEPELTAADVAAWSDPPSSTEAEPSHKTAGRARLECFAAIQPKAVRWVWQNRIPAGKIALIAGDPDRGKSLLTLDIAARISTGRPFPDGAECERGSVIILSAEDDPEDTIRPRLDAAGADVSRIHLMKSVRVTLEDGTAVERGFSLEADIDALDDAVRELKDTRLILMDPISAYLGHVDAHKNAEVRGLLSPLADFTSRTGVGVTGVTHLRKSGGSAMHRSIESIAFQAASRAAWGIAIDEQNPAKRVFARIKGNVGPEVTGLAFEIAVDKFEVPFLDWKEGAVNAAIDDLLGGLEPFTDRAERREALEWLRAFLERGPKPSREVMAQSRQAGLSWATVRRAAKDLEVTSGKDDFGGPWSWSLPIDEDAHFPSNKSK